MKAKKSAPAKSAPAKKPAGKQAAAKAPESTGAIDYSKLANCIVDALVARLK